MAKTFRVGLIGYKFMGRAHSNAWRQAPKFFDLKANVEMHTICGRDAAAVQAARRALAGDWGRNQSKGYVCNHVQGVPTSRKIVLPPNWNALLAESSNRK